MRHQGIPITVKSETTDVLIDKNSNGLADAVERYNQLWTERLAAHPEEAESVLAVLEAAAHVPGSTVSQKLENAVIPIAHTHARIEALCPEKLNDIQEQIDDGRLSEALDDLYLYKRLELSPITAAIGGKYYWSKAACDAALRKPGIMGSLDTDGLSIPHVQSSAWQKEVQEFAARYLRAYIPRRPSDHIDDRTLDLLRNSGLLEINARLQDFENCLCRCVKTGENFPPLIEAEWARLLGERRKIFSKIESTGKIMGFVLATVTLLVTPEPMTAAWVYAGGKTAKRLIGGGGKGGSLASRLIQRDYHRLVQSASQVEDLARSAW